MPIPEKEEVIEVAEYPDLGSIIPVPEKEEIIEVVEEPAQVILPSTPLANSQQRLAERAKERLPKVRNGPVPPREMRTGVFQGPSQPKKKQKDSVPPVFDWAYLRVKVLVIIGDMEPLLSS